jgi:hypothetical protein
MALTSFLQYTDSSLQIVSNVVGTNKVSSAKPEDLAFYDRSAYRRISQVAQTDPTFIADPDYLITSTLFPKASIEILNMLEFGWYPLYVERTLGAFYYKAKETAPGQGQTMTAFEPSRLVKVNQRLIQLECYKAVEIFYSTLITDNANKNEKDAANLNFARKRFEEEWAKTDQESSFYDIRNQGFIGTYQQDWLADVNFFEGDRRYF